MPITKGQSLLSTMDNNFSLTELANSKATYSKKLLIIIESARDAKSFADSQKSLTEFQYHINALAATAMSVADDDNQFAKVYENLKLICTKPIIASVSACLNQFSYIVRNEALLIACQQFVAQNNDYKKFEADCQKLLVSHRQAMNKLLSEGTSYHAWHANNVSKIWQLFHSVTPPRTLGQFVDENLKLNLKFENYLKNLLRKLLAEQYLKLNWENLYEESIGTAYRLDEQIKLFYDQYVETVMNSVTSFANLAELIQHFEKLKSDSDHVKKAGHKSGSRRTISVTIKRDFADYAAQWFQSNPGLLENRNEQTQQALVNKLIKNLSFEAWSLNAEAAAEVHEALTNISNKEVRHEFSLSLEKLYPTPRVKEAWEYVSLKSIADAQVKKNDLTESQLLANAIPEPLEWYQLKLSLENFYTKTQLQFELRKLLQNFVENNLNNNEVNAQELRRYVEYLFCCMCKAHHEQEDDGVLLNRLRSPYTISEAEQNSGINLVINGLSKVEKNLASGILKKSLSDLYARVKVGTIFYLPRSNELVTSVTDIIKKNRLLTAAQQYHLYWKHYDNSLNTKDGISAITELQAACYYLVNAASFGHENALKQITTKPKFLLKHQVSCAENEELIIRLSSLNRDNPQFLVAQVYLSNLYANKLKSHSYADYQSRLKDILQSYLYFNNAKPLASNFTPEQLALDALIIELMGKPSEAWYAPKLEKNITELITVQVEEEKFAPYYPLRILPVSELDKLLIQAGIANKAEIRESINKAMSKNITGLICTVANKSIEITITSAILNDPKITCFIDPKTGCEIARIFHKDDKLHFKAYGDNVHLSFKDKLVADEIILDNPQGKITLEANFAATNIHIGADAAELHFIGDMNVAQTLQIETTGIVDIGQHCKLNTNNFSVRAEVLNVVGSLHATQGGHVNVNSIKNSGSISAEKFLDLQAVTGINLSGAGLINSGDGLSLKAKTVRIGGQSKIKSSDKMKADVVEQILIDKDGTLEVGIFECKTNKLENFSQNLVLGEAQIRVEEDLINHPGSKIKVKGKLRVSGGSVWNHGKIYYGELFSANMNKFFINGLYEPSAIINHGNQISPAIGIEGGDLTVVAGICANVCSITKVKRLSQNALVRIDLFNVLSKTSHTKSALVDLNLGIEIPNINAIAQTVYDILQAGLSGDYEKISKNADAYNSLTSFARWFLRFSAPQFGKLVDLGWSVINVLIASPALLAQILFLYKTNESLAKIELNKLITLVTGTNSLAIQGMNIVGQVETIAHDVHVTPTTSRAAVHYDTLAVDVAAIFLPVTTGNSLISLQGGFHTGFTVINRSFFSVSDMDINLNLNVTRMFEFASHGRHELELASRSSAIGYALDDAGSTRTLERDINVAEHTQSGHTVTRTLNEQATNFRSTAESKTESDDAMYSGENQELGGKHKTHNLTTKASKSTTVEGDIETERAKLSAKENIHHTSSSNLHGKPESKDSSLEETAKNIGTAKGSAIAMKAVSQKGDHLRMGGNTTAQTLVEDAKEDLNMTGSAEAHSTNLHSDHYANVSGHINGTSANDHQNSDSATVRISADEANVAAVITAEKGIVELLAKHDLHVSGVQQAIIHEIAANITDSSRSISTEKIIQANDKLLFSGTAHFPDAMGESVLELIGHKVTMANDSMVAGDGTAVIKADTATIRNLVVANLAVMLDHINNVQDFLTTSGEYSSVKVSDSFNVKLNQDIDITRAMNFVYSLGVSANQIHVNNNMHSDHDISLTSTVGDVHIGKYVVSANEFLRIFSQTNFIADQSTLSGREVFVHALVDIVLNAALSIGENHQEFVAGHDIRLNCIATPYKGEYDTMMHYDTTRLISGAGVGYDNNGLVMQAGNKFYDTAAKLLSLGNNVLIAKYGFEITALIHRYVSYHREYSNWIGKHTETTDYSYQMEQPEFCSMNGSNTMLSAAGYLRAVSALFVAADKTNIACKGSIQLLGLILNYEEKKDKSSVFGIFADYTDQVDDEAAPTEVLSQSDVTIVSEKGRVELLNAYIFTLGLLTIHGVDVLISAPILNHFFSETKRGLTFSTPLQAALESQPVFQDLRSLANGSGLAEGAVNLWNTMIDSKNFANVLSAASKFGPLGNLAMSMLSAQIGYAYSKTSLHYQTVANNVGLHGRNIDIKATESLTADNGVDIGADEEIDLEAKRIAERGADLKSKVDSFSASAGINFSATGPVTGSASASESSQESTTHQNQHIHAKVVKVHATEEQDMKNANIKAEKVVIDTPKQKVTTEAGTTTYEANSVGGSTAGDVSMQHDSANTAEIAERSGVEADDLEENIGEQDLTGAEMKANHATGHVEHTTARGVKEEKNSNSWGGAANVHDLTGENNKAQDPTGDGIPSEGSSLPKSSFIPTATVHFGHENYRGTQESSSQVKSGDNPSAANVSGTLHTQDDGHTTSRDEHINLTGRVPTSAGWDAIKDAFSKPAASIPSATPSQNKVPQKSHPDSPGEVLEDNATSGRRRADEDEDDDLTPLENDTSHTDSAEASDSNHKNREHAGKKPHPYSNLDDDIAANYWSEQIFPKRTIQYKFSDTKPRTQDAEYHSDDRPPAECKNNDWIDYYPYAYVQDSHSDNPNFSNPNAYVCEVDPIIKDPSQVRVEGAKQLGSGFFGIGESMILLYRRRLIGIPVFMGSVDNIYAGGSELITGKEKHTVFHKFMDAIGLDADAVDNAMDVFGTKPSIKSGFEGYNTRQRLRFFDNLNSSQNNSNPTDPQLDPNNEYYDFTFESESRGNVSRHGSGG